MKAVLVLSECQLCPPTIPSPTSAHSCLGRRRMFRHMKSWLQVQHSCARIQPSPAVKVVVEVAVDVVAILSTPPVQSVWWYVLMPGINYAVLLRERALWWSFSCKYVDSSARCTICSNECRHIYHYCTQTADHISNCSLELIGWTIRPNIQANNTSCRYAKTVFLSWTVLSAMTAYDVMFFSDPSTHMR